MNKPNPQSSLGLPLSISDNPIHGLHLLVLTLFLLLLLPVGITLSGCVSEDMAGTGHLALEVTGGQALTHGFPLSEAGVEHRFVDGWQMDFDRFVVVLSDLELTEPGDAKEVVGKNHDTFIIDLMSNPTGKLLWTTLQEVPARRLDIAFSSVSASIDSQILGADPEDVDHMIQNGLSMFISGEARREDKVIHFQLGFAIPTRYHHCINGKDRTQGIAIENNKTVGAYIYFHPHHLFWDSLAAGDTDLRFDAFAATAGEDNLVTEQDLKRQQLTDLRDSFGAPLRNGDGSRVLYNDGGILPPDRLTLMDFVAQGAQSAVHFNGVGLCRMDHLP